VSEEHPVCIDSGGRLLIGVLHRPESADARRAVVVLVGGPQYRVGSHRQFVLLARELCRRGIAVLRFDFSGMGDSDGEHPGFEHADADIRAAVDCLQSLQPSIREVCLWGLCDAASAALMYAPTDARVTRLILLNPWVRTSEGQAQAYLDRYYGRRLRSRLFWRKVFTDPSTLIRAASGYLATLRTASREPEASDRGGRANSYLARMLQAVQAFTGQTLILLSGQDLVATEFELLQQRSQDWRRAFASPRVTTMKLPEATHTFSRQVWRHWVEQASAQFVGDVDAVDLKPATRR
jgi:uncharacterized protein